MPVAIAATVVGLLVVLVAYYRDPPVETVGAVGPDWDLLPDPTDVARTEFPLSFPGYDPAEVETHFDALNRAYADLLAAATPDVLARARHRAALRHGVERDVALTPAATSSEPIIPSAVVPVHPEAPDAEALRAEAALADLESQRATPPDNP